MDAVSLVWERIVSTQAAPARSTVVVAGVVALLVVSIRQTWEVSRHLVTIVHEGSHGVVAMLSGRRLAGIRLHSDSSGVTVSRGRARGIGMIATTFAGYVGPAALGLACAGLIAQRHPIAVLWLLLGCLALLLLQIRNFFGAGIIAIFGVVLFVVSWRLAPGDQVPVAYAVTWFLLLAAPRAVWELQAQRRRGRATGSDADQLARLTHVPGVLWVCIFFAVTGGSLALGAALLRG